jgi:membrane protein implicated in regulation of membrane protease activity
MLYSLFALAAIAYGHYSGQRPLTPLKAAALGLFAIFAGVAIAVLQNWARRAADDSRD